MEFDKIKEEIIDTLKENNDCCSYIDGQENMTDEDWQEIADSVQHNLIFDPCGLTYTADGFTRYLRMKMFNKQ